MLVYVPGLKKGELGATQDIDPVGWVEEHWISVGVGLVYLNQSKQTQQLLLGSVLLVCLGYLAVTLSSLAAVQRKEFAILSALGWRPWQPAGLFILQAFILALTGGSIGGGVALLIVILIGAIPPWDVIVWILPAMLGLALLSSFYPLWQLWRIQPAEMLRAGTSITWEKTSLIGAWFGMHMPAVSGLALRNLVRSHMRALIALGCLFLSAMLLTVMVEGILAFHQTLQGTLLGDYVLCRRQCLSLRVHYSRCS